MRRSRAYPGGARPFANLTPMIDVVFQLIIFFMLVAQFSSQQLIELKLPSVDDRTSELIDAESRAVINVVPPDRVIEEGGAYRLGSRSFDESVDGLQSLARVLGDLRRRQRDLRVFIRADRTESYERVHPAMQAAALAGITSIELVTEPPTSGQGGAR